MQLTLTRAGQVYLPNCIRKELTIEPGDNIYNFVDNKAIILAKEACEKENQCILNESIKKTSIGGFLIDSKLFFIFKILN
jgi:bifunctional DNA-binding transcriptional regulator/antitoxin component of YhaV-PrlF toxin-antitoxin module